MACKHDPTPCPNCDEPRYPYVDHICHELVEHIETKDGPFFRNVDIYEFDPCVVEPSRDRPKEIQEVSPLIGWRSHPYHMTVDLPKNKPGKIHTYGLAGTVHQTMHLDIEVDRTTGEVVSVWFRCCALPFKVSVVDTDRSVEMEQMSKRINTEMELHAVTIVQMPTPEAGRG